MTEKRNTTVEKIALAPVPTNERQHWISVTLIQAGFMISATSLWTGSIMIDGLNLTQIVIAGLIGYLIVVGICWLQGIMGSDLGVPSIIVATQSFGDRGSQFIVSTADAFSGLMSECFGVDIPVRLSIIIWGIVMFTTAAIGFNGLKYLNMLAVPLMCAVTVVGLFITLSGDGIQVLKDFVPTTNNVTMIAGIDMVIGGFIVGAVLSADYTRYQKTRADVFKSSFAGILPIGVILLWAGAAFAIVAGSEDLTVIFIGLGIPVLGLLSLILSTWPANSANAYSAGLGFLKVFRLSDKYRIRITLICGLVGTIVGSFEIIFYFEQFLTYLGVVIAPFAGVMIIDYFVIGKGNPAKWAPTKGINWAGMIALAIGVVAGLVIPWGIVSFNGVIVSAMATLILRKVMPAAKTTTLEDISIDMDE